MTVIETAELSSYFLVVRDIARYARLKGHGMPIVGKPSEHGDLFATADVQLPRQLTPEQRAHFEALQKLERAS